MEKLGIYIHIPFCQAKCGYCDFLSWVPGGRGEVASYLDILSRDLASWEGLIRKRGVQSVFFGGGTPSLLKTGDLLALLEQISSYTDIGQAEVTMEANPESLVDLDLEALVAGGLNRLSLGAQAASDGMLKSLGRVHTRERIIQAFNQARRSGIKNINLDFIFALPGEGRSDIKKNLDLIQDLGPDHISYYALILEEGTPFYDQVQAGAWEVLEEGEDRARMHMIEEALGDMGYDHYEISNFARPGHACRHNLLYWTQKDYLGLGLGAHSKLGKRRFWTTRDLGQYRKRVLGGLPPIEGQEVMEGRDLDRDYVITAIRLKRGLDLKKPLAGGGYLGQVYKYVIGKNLDLGLLEECGGRVRLTRKGRDLANQVELDFYLVD